jgi:3-dehydroquinate synthase
LKKEDGRVLSFGHALETAAGPETLSHGEAVAWGMVRASELGLALGITPEKRAMEITELLTAYDYETKAPHPLAKSKDVLDAMQADKKQSGRQLKFIVPITQGVQIVSGQDNSALEGKNGEDLIRRVINGAFQL